MGLDTSSTRQVASSFWTSVFSSGIRVHVSRDALDAIDSNVLATADPPGTDPFALSELEMLLHV